MIADQIRMARALLRWSVRELAARARVNKAAVVRAENGGRMQAATHAKLQDALAAAGIVFIEAEDGVRGPTVALSCMAIAAPALSEAGLEEAYDDIDRMLDEGERERMLQYWSDKERWEALSDASRQALIKIMGRAPEIE